MTGKGENAPVGGYLSNVCEKRSDLPAPSTHLVSSRLETYTHARTERERERERERESKRERGGGGGGQGEGEGEREGERERPQDPQNHP